MDRALRAAGALLALAALLLPSPAAALAGAAASSGPGGLAKAGNLCVSPGPPPYAELTDCGPRVVVRVTTEEETKEFDLGPCENDCYDIVIEIVYCGDLPRVGSTDLDDPTLPMFLDEQSWLMDEVVWPILEDPPEPKPVDASEGHVHILHKSCG